MTNVLTISIVVFITQIVFIGARTLNVKAIADKNIPRVLWTGALIHFAWLLSIAIGATSMYEIMSNFDWNYLPVVLCSLSGGLLGSYWGMVQKAKK